MGTLSWKCQNTANSQYSRILGLPFHLLAKVCSKSVCAQVSGTNFESHVPSCSWTWQHSAFWFQLPHCKQCSSSWSSHYDIKKIFFGWFHCLKLASSHGARVLSPGCYDVRCRKKETQNISYIILLQLWGVMVHGVQYQQIKNIFIKLVLYKQSYILTGWYKCAQRVTRT